MSNLRLLLPVLTAAFVSCAPGDAPEDVEDETPDLSEEELTSVKRRFDVATLNCSNDGANTVCPASSDKCLCMPMMDALNYEGPRHFLAVGSDKHKSRIHANDNVQAAYIDNMNDGAETLTGAQRADGVMQHLSSKFPSGVPKWIIINEISASRWPDDDGYRNWVVAFARRLHGHYNKEVVIAAPFERPGHHAADWTALGQTAYVGAEVYLTGADINKSGNSVAWCRARYQASIDAYGKLGVPKSRLMLFEHFGNTVAGTKWGRSGVSKAGWKNAIEARTKAANELNFAGFVSYSWASNQMNDTQATKLDFADLYTGLTVP